MDWEDYPRPRKSPGQAAGTPPTTVPAFPFPETSAPGAAEQSEPELPPGARRNGQCPSGWDQAWDSLPHTVVAALACPLMATTALQALFRAGPIASPWTMS